MQGLLYCVIKQLKSVVDIICESCLQYLRILLN